LTNDVWRCLFQALCASGDCLSRSAGMVRIAVSRSETERHQTALRGRAPDAFPRRDRFVLSLSRGMLDVAPQKPLRADEPVTQIDELGLRRVTASNPAGAAGIETRVRFWDGLVAAAPASVSLHSVVGPQQSCCSLPKQSWCKRGRTPSGSMFGSSVTGPGANPALGGVGRVPQRDGEVKPHKTVSKVAVVVSAPVRRAAPRAGPKVRHSRSCRLFPLSWFPVCAYFTRAGTS
jgi:hypothetical protein